MKIGQTVLCSHRHKNIQLFEGEISYIGKYGITILTGDKVYPTKSISFQMYSITVLCENYPSQVDLKSLEVTPSKSFKKNDVAISKVDGKKYLVLDTGFFQNSEEYIVISETGIKHESFLFKKWLPRIGDLVVVFDQFKNSKGLKYVDLHNFSSDEIIFPYEGFLPC